MLVGCKHCMMSWEVYTHTHTHTHTQTPETTRCQAITSQMEMCMDELIYDTGTLKEKKTHQNTIFKSCVEPCMLLHLRVNASRLLRDA